LNNIKIEKFLINFFVSEAIEYKKIFLQKIQKIDSPNGNSIVSLKMYCSCKLSTQNDEETFERMKEHFKNDTLDYKVFCSILQESNAIISGGTILRMLNNDKDDKYDLADIDIYVNKSKANILMKHLNNIFDYTKIPLFSSVGKIYYYDDKYHPIPPINNLKGYPQIFPSIVELYSYRCMRKISQTLYDGTTFQAMSYIRPYQIIILEDSITPQEFVKSFDITFCQNYFDGKNFISYHPMCVKQRKGYMTREIDEDHQYRIRKYERRGYTSLNLHYKE